MARKKIDTRAKATALLREALDKTQHRVTQLRAQDGDNENTIKLVASSNAPDLRFMDTGEEFVFGNEILSHDPKHINLGRVKDGIAPLLFNHNTDALIGIIESARTQNKERLVAKVRFSKEEDAQKRKRQVDEGILKGVSIGYRVGSYRELIPNPIDNGFRTFESTDLEIFEISLVSTPADPTVGVGRNITEIVARDAGVSKTTAQKLVELLELDMKTVHESGAANGPSTIEPKDEDEIEEKTETDSDLVDGDEEIDRPDEPEALTAGGGGADKSVNNENGDIVINERAVTQGDTQTNGDTQMSEKQNESARVTTDNDAIKAERERAAELTRMGNEYNVPADTVNEWLLAGRSSDSVAKEILQMDREDAQIDTRGAGNIELDKRDAHRSFSFVRATNSMLAGGKLTGFEKEMHDEIAQRLGRSPNGMGFFVPTSLGARQLVMDVPGDGPELVFERPGEFIELLRNKTRVVQLGARIMSGLSDKVTLPRRTSANSTEWIDEADSTGVAQTTGSFDQVALAPKQLLSRTAASKQLLAVANYDVEELIRDDFARSFAVAFDRAAISGSTNGPDPEGILNATGVTDNSTAGSGSIPTYEQMITLETSVAENNADDGRLGYLTTPGVYGQLQATESFANTARTIIMDAEVNGFEIVRSSNVPSDGVLDGLDVGNAVIFGDWSQLILGEWGALEIIVDPFSLKHRGLVEYNAIMLADVAIRHPESFAFNFGARVTAQ